MSELFSKAMDDVADGLQAIVEDEGLTYAEKCAATQRCTMQLSVLGIGETLSRIGEILSRIEAKL